MEEINNQLVIEGSGFQELISEICRESGIKIPENLRTEAEYYLRGWLMERMIFNYEDYCAYLFSKEGTNEEVSHMVNVITTIIGFMQ